MPSETLGVGNTWTSDGADDIQATLTASAGASTYSVKANADANWVGPTPLANNASVTIDAEDGTSIRNDGPNDLEISVEVVDDE